MNNDTSTLKGILEAFIENPIGEARKYAPDAKTDKEALRAWGELLIKCIEVNTAIIALKTVAGANYSRLIEEFAPDMPMEQRERLSDKYNQMLEADITNGGTILSDVVEAFIKSKGNVCPYGRDSKNWESRVKDEIQG